MTDYEGGVEQAAVVYKEVIREYVAENDRLRERASELRSLAPDPDVPYLMPSTKEIMALAMRSAASEMEQAADLILELRNDLRRADDENARLRSCLTDDAENARLIMGENARLRELLQRTWDAFHNASSKEFNAVKRDLREQGVEVD